jgi:phosphoglycerol transferase MdoB-like AlkP superfamily enzyme
LSATITSEPEAAETRTERVPFHRARPLRFLAGAALVLLTVLALHRLWFLLSFRGTSAAAPASDLARAIWIGLRFDLRLTALLLAPIALASLLPRVNPMRSFAARRVLVGLLALCTLGVLTVYEIDRGHYDYLQLRIDASSLRFLDNADIAGEMVVQSYPVVSTTLRILVLTAVAAWLLFRLAGRTLGASARPLGGLHGTLAVLAGFLGIALSIYGSLGWYPLRWDRAMFSSDPFVRALGLNPLLNVFDTMETRDYEWDEEAARAAEPLVARFLGIEPRGGEQPDYLRVAGPEEPPARRPNVVLVLLESFAANKLGILGNPHDATPSLDRLAREGFLFSRFYVPHTGTARSVFTAVTGVPDVSPVKTASRNQRVIDQHSILRDFEGYDRYYFLGGSASWANIRGVLAGNVPDLEIYEEGSYDAPKEDVWGISDLALFRFAHEVLTERESDAPFVALIQTSGNHRPWTIPDDNEGFEVREPPGGEDGLVAFTIPEEYNALRFMDHAVGRFIERVEESGLAEDTIFVFWGDHGIVSSPSPHMGSEDLLALNHLRVPLVIWGPGLVEPGRDDSVASELDVLPIVAGLAGVRHRNTTLGRDLLAPGFDGERAVFTFMDPQSDPWVGVVTDRYRFEMKADGTQRSLFDLANVVERVDVSAEHPEEAARLEALTRALLDTSHWLLHNNTQARADAAR